MRRLLLGCLLLTLLLAGCGSSLAKRETARARFLSNATVTASASAATIAANNTRLRQGQDATYVAALQKWRASHIMNYRLVISEMAAFSRVTETRSIVRNGQISEVCRSVNQPTCIPSTDLGSSTVEYLFGIIREYLDDLRFQVTVTYDSIYGLPRAISVDSDQITDVGRKIIVFEFEALP